MDKKDYEDIKDDLRNLLQYLKEDGYKRDNIVSKHIVVIQNKLETIFNKDSKSSQDILVPCGLHSYQTNYCSGFDECRKGLKDTYCQKHPCYIKEELKNV